MAKIKRVICAISGGLDSAVAAALLKEAGFDVVGVFMKLWLEPEENGLIGVSSKCYCPEAEIRAKKVAKILKIPFYLFDFSKEFKERVVDYFLNELKKGNTPNPCVVCNKEIKFGLLLKKTLELGFDFLATGHYVRKTQASGSKIFKLMRAKDKKKDQSYFLWTLNQEKLKRIIFPIGHLKREEVEKIAEKLRLPVIGVKKSVELCFIRKSINHFLEKYLGKNPGKIITKSGKIIGEHSGLWFYTIGQRKGLLISPGPYYVLGKNKKKNILIVTKEKKDLYQKEMIVKNPNWISGKEPKFPLKVRVKIRYLSEMAMATVLKINSKKLKVIFHSPQRAITSGQSAVFYKGEEVLGGGNICVFEEKV